MKNKFKILLALSLMLLTGCEKKTPINMPTASSSGVLYGLGSSIASIWNKDLKDIRAVSQGSNGGIENLNLIYSKEANVSMGVTSIIYQSFKGEGIFEGRPNPKLRILFGLYYNPNQILVKNSDSIKNIKDLENLSFAPGAAGSTSLDEFKAHAEIAGLDRKKMHLQYMGPQEAADMIRNKNLDGLWLMSGAPNSLVMELTSTASMKLLSLDDDFLKKLKASYPWYSTYIIKASSYEGIAHDIQTSAIKMVLYTSSDMDEDLAYRLTKSFFENLEDLKKTNPSLREVSSQNATKDLANIPLHPGAEKYFKEIGVLGAN